MIHSTNENLTHICVEKPQAIIHKVAFSNFRWSGDRNDEEFPIHHFWMSENTTKSFIVDFFLIFTSDIQDVNWISMLYYRTSCHNAIEDQQNCYQVEKSHFWTKHPAWKASGPRLKCHKTDQIAMMNRKESMRMCRYLCELQSVL
jgi:hypothetical protein